MKALILILAGMVATGQAQVTPLVARYNMRGVTGTMTFTHDGIASNPVQIALNLSGLPVGFGISYELKLRSYRVNYDSLDPCADAALGPELGNVPGITSGSGTQSVSNIQLSGTSSVEGRSFVMQSNNGLKICANIEADEDYITAFANLPAYLGGDVIFRQRAASADADTFIYTNLYYVDSTSNPPTGQMAWRIYDGVVAMDTTANTNVANRCGSTIGSMYNPTAVSGNGCSSTNHAACKIGDLSTKLGNIAAGMAFHNDLNLPLSGQSSIIGKTIGFLAGDTVVACANIWKYDTKEAVAEYSNKNASGSITFTQASPLDVTVVKVMLNNLQNEAGGYHVHEWPVPQKLKQSMAVCMSDDVRGHYNPFNYDIATSPTAGTGTPDQYEVGDISGKFGTLANKDSIDATYSDTNLQLFGMHSIIGRSMVIHNPSGSRWICATIQPTEEMTIGIATFHYPIIGSITLKQAKGKPYAETQVYVELNTGRTDSPTTGHKWHIHEREMTGDILAPYSRCMTGGGHYNPYGVDHLGDYATACSGYKQFRCELGDLSGKHGRLTVRSANGKMQKAFFTDRLLPMTGPQSVLGRSIVIHMAGGEGGREACANVYERAMKTAVVEDWIAAPGSSPVSGKLEFLEYSSETLQNIATIDLGMTNLANQAGGYHVHLYPTSPGSSVPCSNEDVGSHYNPFNAPYPGPATGTHDMYEVGDLSGKFGALSGDAMTKVYQDTNLPLTGFRSIIGRSVVVHKNNNEASRWSCGNIKETTPGAVPIKLRATFTGDVVGSVQMTQMRYVTGELSDTFVVMDLKYKADSGRKTSGHKWHVVDDCSSGSNICNPYMVDTEFHYSECSDENPLRCMMGDQSAKLGPYMIGGGKSFYTDVNLPLEGEFRAAMRSVVLGVEGGVKSRLACAYLMPFDAPESTIEQYSFNKVDDFNRTHMEETIASSVDTSPYNVAVVLQTPVSSDCMTAKVYFLGPHATNLTLSFSDVLRSGNENTLQPYHKNDMACKVGGSDMLTASLLLLVSCFLLSRLQRH